MKKDKDLNVLIAVPTGGNVNIMFTSSMMGLKTQKTIKMGFCISMDKPLDRARSMLVQIAKAQNCSHIFFVDDDMWIPPQALNHLLSLDKDIVSGLYFVKNAPHTPVALKLVPKKLKRPQDCSYAPSLPTKLAEVDAVGMGCCLIKMKVFDKVKMPYFLWKYYENKENKEQPFNWLGEDIFFCEKAKKAGFKVWCEPRIVCSHFSTIPIGPRHFYEESKKQFPGGKWKFANGEAHTLEDIKFK